MPPLGQRRDLGCRSCDLERNLDGPGSSAGHSLARSNCFHEIEVRVGVLLDELLTLQAQPLGSRVYLGRLRPVFDR